MNLAEIAGAAPKEVVKPQEARQVVESSVLDEPATPAPAKVEEQKAPKPSWKFVKLYGVSELLTFRDGSEFKFRLIRLNDRGGYSPTSEVVTDDETLAKNLRAAEKRGRHGVVEVKI